MNRMEETVEEMMKYVCDEICRHRRNGLDQDRMDEICAECDMGDHVCHILNEYESVAGREGQTAPSWSAGMMDRFMCVR